MRFFFSFLLFLTGIFHLYAKQFTVNPLPVIYQLPSNTVNRMMQDKDGFLWLGTMDGLCKYDGYSLSVFRSNPGNPQLLADNEITSLAEDYHNTIWIGTRGGINLLNRETYEITRFSIDPIKDQRVYSILCASDSSIWIGADSEVFRYHPSKKTIELMTGSFSRKSSASCLYEDHFGNIWILQWNNGLHCYKKDGSIIHYPRIGTENSPFYLYQDKDNQYWIGTWGNGLYRFSPEKDSGSMYAHCPIYKRNNTQDPFFFSIVQDNVSGYLWLMSTSGIYAIQPQADHSVRQADISYLFEKSNKNYKDLIKDSKGNLWVGTYDEGAFSINFDKPNIHNIALKELAKREELTPYVTALYKGADPVLWLNQLWLGLCTYDMHTHQLHTFLDTKELQSHSQLFSNISCMENVEGKMWLGNAYHSLIAIVERKEETLSLHQVINLRKIHPAPNSTRRIFKDSKSNIWIIGSQNVFVKPHYQEDVILFSERVEDITTIAEAPDGSIWMSTKKDIYSLTFKPNSNLQDAKIICHNKDRSTLKDNNIIAMASDADGHIWLGTKNGTIVVYDPVKRNFEEQTSATNRFGEAILDIVADTQSNIWISTNKRIIEYNRTTGATRDYSETDGLVVNSFNAGSYFYDKLENALYFGGNRGICKFSLLDLAMQKEENPKVLISDVKISGQSLLHGSENFRLKAVSQKLTLLPDDKNIEIYFTSLNYTYPEKIIYAYKMEGVDDDWVYTHRQFAVYNTLKKGIHKFHVKATNVNRIWSDQITTFVIYKQPAFYETWWAYTLYVCIALCIAYLILRIVRNRIRLKQELQIAQIEKDKSEDLTQTKLRYFTNISHDLLTPLTIISCLIDDIETVVSNKIPQLETIRASVNRLKRLLQQVLDFRKMESGNMKLRVTRGDISTFVKDICLNNFSPLFHKKKIHFSFESALETVPAYFDADKVEKIIYHLLSNALKYTPENGTIATSLQALTQNHLQCISIVIRDTGVGIAPENINDIFTRFYNNKNIEAGQTNGIGLSLTRDLVELHHGTITVESRLNEGSAFTIVLPIDKSAYNRNELDDYLMTILTHNEAKNSELEETGNPDPALHIEDINLLLVEDNEEILSTLKNILQKQYHVFTAENGLQALERVEHNDIDIIISDVMMPEMDGLELSRTLKRDLNTSHIPILLLTAKNSVEGRIECYDAGADGYISKPFDMKLLKARISNFLANRRKKQEEFKSNAEINISTLNYPSIDADFLDRAVRGVEKYLNDTNFDIDLFAREMNLSNSSLYRKIKTMTGLSPNEFIRNIRLKHACQMLKDKSVNISEVADAVGFITQRYFATCFKTAFGMTPTEYQKNSCAPTQ